jgi:ATP-dependent DNA helicase RecG
LYDDRLEIISPGELHFGLTPELLYQPHESKPWNPWIAKVFHRRGIIETWGRGTLKIASLMQAAGLPVPILQERTESVVMTFLLPHHLGGVNVGVNVGVNGLLAYIQANPGQRAGEMAVTFAVTQRTIERWLKQLKAQALIEFKGAPKTGGYHRTADNATNAKEGNHE